MIKKNKSFYTILLIILLLFTLTGCGQGPALSAEEFKTISELEKYNISDVSSDEIYNSQEAYFAIDRKGNFQVEFYVFANEEDAKNIFNKIKETLDSDIYEIKKTWFSDRWLAKSNWSYVVISKIDNTLVYSSSSSIYEQEINNLLSALEY